MAKYIKLEDAIRKYAEMIADEAYWEHGVGNGKPDDECLDIAREYYSDLPTIEVSEDCISREYLLSKVYDMDNDNLVVDLKDIEVAPSVVPSCQKNRQVERAEGKWIYIDEPIMGNPYGRYRCSECELEEPHKTDYCPNCGAKMKG